MEKDNDMMHFELEGAQIDSVLETNETVTGSIALSEINPSKQSIQASSINMSAL